MTCKFSSLDSLVSYDEVSYEYSIVHVAALVDKIALALVGEAVFVRFLSTWQRPDLVTLLQEAAEFRKKEGPPRIRSNYMCSVRTYGNCTGKGFADGKDLAKRLEDNAKAMEKALKKYLPIAAHYNTRKAIFNGLYCNLIFQIQNCVDNLVQSQKLETLKYCNTGEYFIGETCTEKKIIYNRGE